MKTNVTPELLTAYFSGQATAFQKQLLDEWVTDAANREVFYYALATWESQQPQYVADVDKGIQGHQIRMVQLTNVVIEDETPDETPTLNSRWGWWLWLAAASVLLVLGGGWLFRENWQYQQFRTTYGETRHLTLPDGSTVVLNANSRLQVPRFGFGNVTREVMLAGEASFSVTHTIDNLPFVVKTARKFDVKVLGTEFTVFARKRGGKVTLNKGRIELRYQEGSNTRQLLMKPGDLVTLDPGGHAQQKQVKKPENESAWQQNRYVFANTSLGDIGQLFAENYGLQLNFADPDLANWTVSGSFTAHSSDDLLEVLMEASSLTYIRHGTHIQIAKRMN